jgi:hypothetical protein
MNQNRPPPETLIVHPAVRKFISRTGFQKPWAKRLGTVKGRRARSLRRRMCRREARAWFQVGFEIRSS